MNIHLKAMIETVKMLGIFLLMLVSFYFLLDFLGPKLGAGLFILTMISGFAWLNYDYYLHKFRMEKNSRYKSDD